RRPSRRWQIALTLPGTSASLEIPAEFAWENTKSQAGLRFVDITPQAMMQVREWLRQNSPDAEQDDPPIRCQLTDLSMGGCYLEISSPFPVCSRLIVSMRAGEIELPVQGVVRLRAPDRGMGVQFTQNTSEQRSALEKFLRVLMENRTLLPELFVQPEGLEPENETSNLGALDNEDPLLQLFGGESLSAEAF